MDSLVMSGNVFDELLKPNSGGKEQGKSRRQGTGDEFGRAPKDTGMMFPA